MRHRSFVKSGFTLIELLVVVAIVALLVLLGLPAVQEVRESARRSQCLNNLKQLGLGLQLYLSTYSGFPVGDDSNLLYSAHVQLLPFLEQENLYNSFNFSIGPSQYYDPIQMTAIRTNLAVLHCPSDPLPDQYPRASTTNYAANNGNGIQFPYNGIFNTGPFLAISSVSDGTHQTAAFSEWLVDVSSNSEPIRQVYHPTDLKTGPPTGLDQFSDRCHAISGMIIGGEVKGSVWVLGLIYQTLYNHLLPPNDYSCHNTINSTIHEAATATSYHRRGVNVAFVDGHVAFIRQGVERSVWWALATRNGGEVISPESF